MTNSSQVNRLFNEWYLQVLRWIRRIYLKKAKVDGIEAFHSGKKSDDNPYNMHSEDGAERFNNLLWHNGWADAFMWHAAKHNLPSYEHWERIKRAELSRKAKFDYIFDPSTWSLILFMFCPRRFRYGLNNVRNRIVLLLVIVITVGGVAYNEETGIEGSVVGVVLFVAFIFVFLFALTVAVVVWDWIRKATGSDED